MNMAISPSLLCCLSTVQQHPGECQIDLARSICRWPAQAELQQLSGRDTGAAGVLCRQWALRQDWQALALQTGLQICSWLAADLCRGRPLCDQR